VRTFSIAEAGSASSAAPPSGAGIAYRIDISR
jgi:hypothetical protein